MAAHHSSWGGLRALFFVVVFVLFRMAKNSSSRDSSRTDPEHRVDSRAIAQALSEWAIPNTGRSTPDQPIDGPGIARAVRDWQNPRRTPHTGITVRTASPRSDPMWDRELDG